MYEYYVRPVTLPKRELLTEALEFKICLYSFSSNM